MSKEAEHEKIGFMCTWSSKMCYILMTIGSSCTYTFTYTESQMFPEIQIQLSMTCSCNKLIW